MATAVADSSDSLAAKGLVRPLSVSSTERHNVKSVPESILETMKLAEISCTKRATQEGTKSSQVVGEIGVSDGV